MNTQKPGRFLFRYTIVGLIVAVAVLYLFPGLLQQQAIVQITEAPQTAATATSGPYSYADAVDRAAPAVVNIYTAKVVTRRRHPLLDDPVLRYFFGQGNQRIPRHRLETSLGSGVIVSPSGYLLTNNHVIEGADQIHVALRDGRSAEARVVGSDADTDLAVLKIDLPQLPAITMGGSDNLRVGDVSLAIGNPFGVGQTVTLGIISATGRNRLGINTFEDFIQTDAAINPGNSGGALINARGELIGINTAIYSKSGGSQGIGFAIPVNLARGVMEQIIEHGRVERGWLGIEVQDLTPELAESFDLEHSRGVLITGVLRNGPAYRAGLRPGDAILAIDGREVADSVDSLNLIARHLPGSRLHIEGVRSGEPFQAEATVGRRPDDINHR